MDLTKKELIKELKEVLEEIPFLEYVKENSLKYLNLPGNKKIKTVDYQLSDSKQTAFGIDIEPESIENAKARMKRLPLTPKYFIYIYSLYEGYLETIGDNDKDKKDLNLLKYRILRNVIIHNLGIIKQKNINEFNKRAREYKQNITQGELNRLFDYTDGVDVRWGIKETDLEDMVALIESKTYIKRRPQKKFEKKDLKGILIYTIDNCESAFDELKKINEKITNNELKDFNSDIDIQYLGIMNRILSDYLTIRVAGLFDKDDRNASFENITFTNNEYSIINSIKGNVVIKYLRNRRKEWGAHISVYKGLTQEEMERKMENNFNTSKIIDSNLKELLNKLKDLLNKD
jgi:hypothetical protein